MKLLGLFQLIPFYWLTLITQSSQFEGFWCIQELVFCIRLKFLSKVKWARGQEWWVTVLNDYVCSEDVLNGGHLHWSLQNFVPGGWGSRTYDFSISKMLATTGKERKTDYVDLCCTRVMLWNQPSFFHFSLKLPLFTESSCRWKLHNNGVRSVGLCIDGFTLCQLEEQERASGIKKERVRGRNEKRTVVKLSSWMCQLPLTSQKWPIMFYILSLSGGGKEQRCRVGCLEESSVANSIVNIIPYHLLPVKGQAKFVLCCTHGSPVAKSRETLSGQHEHRRARSHKTMPTVTPTA